MDEHFAGVLTTRRSKGNRARWIRQPPTSGCSFLMRLRSSRHGGVKTDALYIHILGHFARDQNDIFRLFFVEIWPVKIRVFVT